MTLQTQQVPDYANPLNAEECRVMENIIVRRVDTGDEVAIAKDSYLVRSEEGTVRYTNSTNVVPAWFVVSEKDKPYIVGTGKKLHRSQDYFDTN